MISYPHNPREWLAMTVGLSFTEEAILTRLLDWTMMNEAYLPLDFEECCRIARIPGSGDVVTRRNGDVTPLRTRYAVTTVLQRFWDVVPDRGYSFKASNFIPNPGNLVPRAMAIAAGNRARQERHRERKAELARKLRDEGVKTYARMSLAELRTLEPGTPGKGPERGDDPGNDEGLSSRRDNAVTTVTTSVTTSRAYAGNGNSNTNTNTPLDPSGLGRAPAREAVVTRYDTSIAPTRRALAGMAFARAGMRGINTADPRLEALLGQGVTDEELEVAAGEAVARGKPYAYALAIVKARREEAAQIAAQALTVEPSKPESVASRMAQWSPSTASLKAGS